MHVRMYVRKFTQQMEGRRHLSQINDHRTASNLAQRPRQHYYQNWPVYLHTSMPVCASHSRRAQQPSDVKHFNRLWAISIPITAAAAAAHIHGAPTSRVSCPITAATPVALPPPQGIDRDARTKHTSGTIRPEKPNISGTISYGSV